MLPITITPELKQICPETALGCLQAKVTVRPSSESLWMHIRASATAIKRDYALAEVPSLPVIHASREAYKSLGKDPSRYRLSSESLLRRILQGKDVYRINNVVEINNLISIRSHFSVGCYDVERLNPPVTFACGKAGETYKGIGRDMINVESLPVFSDASGHFGSPTSDSERAMIRPETREILLCVISFSGTDGLANHLETARKLLTEYADGQEFSLEVVS